MADTSFTTATDFVCTVCQRRFTKKEHLKRHERAHTGSKPFRCGTCDRSFSRRDVLNRHSKNHTQVTPSRRLSEGTESQTRVQPSPSGSHDTNAYQLRVNSQDTAPGSSTEDGGDGGGDEHNPAIPSRWPGTAATDHVLRPHLSSSLLWPDSEDFFHNLTSTDWTAWDDHAAPLMLLENSLPPQNTPSVPLIIAPTVSPFDEPTVTEDGRRAVQTTNSLLTNAFLDVTSNSALFDLTPRFLDSSLHTFFTKFVPILPIIHRPSFVYRDCSAPLLLNCIALGSLFLGTEDAVATGECLWRLAYTAIATAWPKMIGHRREYDACSGVELVVAALLSQTYAALSRDRTLRMTSQTFYGLTMHWAQYCGMYDMGQVETAEIPLLDDPIEAKIHAWKAWVARETQLRALLGLCVIDGVVSQFSGNRVNTSASTSSLPFAAPSTAFTATSADEWIYAMNRHNSGIHEGEQLRFHDLYEYLLENGTQATPVKSLSDAFNVKAILEILASRVFDLCNADQGSHSSQSRQEVMGALVSLRQILLESETLPLAERSIGLLRWHAVCLNLIGSTARGARRMCHHYGIDQHIFGGKKRQEPSQVNPERWTHGLPARKCLLHAIEIHKIACDVPLGIMHDTCLPGALFAAATTYSSFALPGLTKMLVPASLDWKTVVTYEPDEVPRQAARLVPDEMDHTRAFLTDSIEVPISSWTTRNLLYELSSIRMLMHSLAHHWGVIQEMEDVVSSWEARCV